MDQDATHALEFETLMRLVQPGEDLVCAGADLRVGTLLSAYSHGLFPMGLGRDGAGPTGWWSPDPRGVLPLDDLRVSSSLRRSCRRYQVRVDTAFDDVVAGCAADHRDGRWITGAVQDAYRELHHGGHAHSVETWSDGVLVGGLYGVSIGGLFAGESMFHRANDASKVALVALVEMLRADGDRRRLLDVQWSTEHLASLGVVEAPRPQYLALLARALQAPAPSWG